MEGFITSKDAAEKWGIGERRVRAMCSEGRIKGASKFGSMWVIPEDTKRPVDLRIKSGKYIKEKT